MAENEKQVEGEEDIADLPVVEEGKEDLTDYKALAAKNAAIAKRYKTKLEKSKLAEKVDKGVERVLSEKENKEKIDYARLAYLETKGIVSDEDVAYVEGVAKETGKNLRDLFGSKWFQAELKERQEVKAGKEAIPQGAKRSAPSTRDDVEYWVAKGEMPDLVSQRDLAIKVVNARIKAERGKEGITSRPVI